MSLRNSLLDVLKTALRSDGELPAKFESLPITAFEGSRLTTISATLPYNVAKNRYINILPFDETRVPLRGVQGEEGSDYINANFMKTEGCPFVYIATQGPLPETYSHFWSMVWEQNVQNIVMLTKFEESGMVKCGYYIPMAKKADPIVNGFELTVTEESQLPNFIVRKIMVRNQAENLSRVITHFQYTLWPDHGAPQSAAPVLSLISAVRKSQNGATDPVVVHCSAGCGRTGTYCTIDTAIYFLEQEDCGRFPPQTDLVYHLVNGFRRQRIGVVQTLVQYKFCYRAILEYFGVQ